MKYEQKIASDLRIQFSMHLHKTGNIDITAIFGNIMDILYLFRYIVYISANKMHTNIPIIWLLVKYTIGISANLI